MTIEKLQEQVNGFAQERDWEQFHSIKNLCMALSVEAGELSRLFEWLSCAESDVFAQNNTNKEKIADELADIMMFLLRLSEVTGIDLSEAVQKKLAKNVQKYPVELVKGKAHKYTHYRNQEDDI